MSGCDILQKVLGLVEPACGSDILEIVRSHTGAIVRGLQLVCAHHGMDEELLGDLALQVSTYLWQSKTELEWMKNAKYILASPLASYLRNVLPKEPPGGPFRFSGKLRRWYRARQNAFSRTNTHLWYSWFQAKRSADPVTEEVIESVYRDHRKQMSRPDPLADEPELVDFLLDQKLVREVISHVRNDLVRDLEHVDFGWRSISSNACFENPRSAGGARLWLRSLYFGSDPLRCNPLLSQEMHSMMPRVKHAESGRTRFYETNYVSSFFFDLPILLEGELRVRQAIDDVCYAEIRGVLEPLKVRVISKGPALDYHLARPLQRALHTSMRKMPCFRLIGRRLSPTDLLDLARKGATHWNSIDYSAATDGLSSTLGLAIMNALLDHPKLQAWKKLANRVLGRHQIQYPDDFDIEPVMQQNGQLMGSILSFPILCIANLITYVRALRTTDRDDLNRVLINGDDMLYASDEETFKRHESVAALVGLEMSVGKAYTHPTYANVNSVSFHASPSGDFTPWQINFLNVGLLLGKHKVQRADTAEDHHKSDSFVDNLKEALSGSLPGRQSDVLRSYLLAHKREIEEELTAVAVHRSGRRENFVRNLFAAPGAGGAGVDAPADWRFKITALQRRLVPAELYSVRPLLQKEAESDEFGSEPLVYSAKAETDRPVFRVKARKTRNCCLGSFFVCWEWGARDEQSRDSGPREEVKVAAVKIFDPRDLRP